MRTITIATTTTQYYYICYYYSYYSIEIEGETRPNGEKPTGERRFVNLSLQHTV